MCFHLASETTHVLDNDSANTIGLDSVQQSGEARAVLNRVGSTHGGIVEIAYDPEVCVPKTYART